MFRWIISVLIMFLITDGLKDGFATQPTQPTHVSENQVSTSVSKADASPSIVPVKQEPIQQVTPQVEAGKQVAAIPAPQGADKVQSKLDIANVTPSLLSQSDKAAPVDAPVPSVIVELLPHKATYSVTLDKTNYENKNYSDEDIENANGQMTIQVAKAGDGWAIEQKLTLHIYYKDGTAEQVITSLATYESMDGLKYNFNARTLRGDVEEIISGDAILASKGGAGIVTYQQPDESTVQLPVGTIFPTQHLIYMLESAMKGQKVVSNIVFDGSSETHEPVQVNTILGVAQEPKLALTNKDILQFKKAWPMRMAIYAVDSPSAEPDYEITQSVLDRGVIRDMTLDYGTFKVKAVLQEVVVFN